MFAGESLPLVNAVLNLTCAVLLVIGFVAVRRRRLRIHITAMLSAFVVSLVFLTSYLYYHLAIRHGQPTHFTGEGALRPIYFAILGTHTALAPVMAICAVITVFFGMSGRLGRHVRIARWTLPIWFYVSVTGVVVYWMLYQLYPALPEVVQSTVHP